MTAVRLLLIDDHALFRSGLRLVLQAGIAQAEVMESASLEQVMRAAIDPPSLVLLDIQLQGLNGLDGLALLRQRWPGVPVVMLSSSAEPDTVRLAMARGAAAFFSKADTAQRIIQVIQATLCPGSAEPARPKPRLTPRQCQVLDLLSEGLSNKAIARRMDLSEFTVRGHVQAVLGLLGVTSRSQAIFAARSHGLIG